VHWEVHVSNAGEEITPLWQSHWSNSVTLSRRARKTLNQLHSVYPRMQHQTWIFEVLVYTLFEGIFEVLTYIRLGLKVQLGCMCILVLWYYYLSCFCLSLTWSYAHVK
jgi:hypothetical protein